MILSKIRKELHGYKKPGKKEVLQRFFKTGKGQYAEGDVFVGVMVPQVRDVAKKYFTKVSLPECEKLLSSKIHEERLLALIILTYKFFVADKKEQEKIYKLYLKNLRQANNWDLIDLSADKILGAHLFDKNKNILDTLVRSKNMWERRAAIIATFYFIKNGQTQATYKLAKILLEDKEDLLQKATGWMLREAGKRCSELELVRFLQKDYHLISRTTLRYAIEKFPKEKQTRFLKGNFS